MKLLIQGRPGAEDRPEIGHIPLVVLHRIGCNQPVVAWLADEDRQKYADQHKRGICAMGSVVPTMPLENHDKQHSPGTEGYMEWGVYLGASDGPDEIGPE